MTGLRVYDKFYRNVIESHRVQRMAEDRDHSRMVSVLHASSREMSFLESIQTSLDTRNIIIKLIITL